VAHDTRPRHSWPTGDAFSRQRASGSIRSFGVRQVLIKKSKTVRGRSSSRRSPSGPGVVLLSDPSDQGLGPSHSLLVTRPSSRGARGSSGCSTAPTPSPSAIRTSPGGRRHPCVRAHQAGGSGPSTPGSGRRESSKESGHSSSHPGVQSPARAHRGTTWFAGRDAEGTRASPTVPELCTPPSTPRSIGATMARYPRHPSLGPVYRAHRSGRITAAAGHHVPPPQWMPSLLLSTEATATCTGSTISHGASSTPRRSRCRVRSPTAWYRRSSSNPSRRSSDAGHSGNEHPGNREGFDRLRDRCLQQRRLPDMKIGGVDRQVFGFEWGYQGSAQRHRSVVHRLGRGALQRQRLLRVRTDQGNRRLCIALPQRTTLTPSATVSKPIRSGQAFCPSKHHALTVQRRRIYYGGYDCNSTPPTTRRGFASSTLRSLRLSVSPKGRSS